MNLTSPVLVGMRRFIFFTIAAITMALPALAESSTVTQLANFQDGWGNTGSFWHIHYQNTDYVTLKFQNHENKGAADFTFDRSMLAQFEKNLIKFKKMPNRLKNEGFQVPDDLVLKSGDAVQQMVMARMGGNKFKTIQVVQTKGSNKLEHGIALTNDTYNQLKRAIKKVRRKLKWQ